MLKFNDQSMLMKNYRFLFQFLAPVFVAGLFTALLKIGATEFISACSLIVLVGVLSTFGGRSFAISGGIVVAAVGCIMLKPFDAIILGFTCFAVGWTLAVQKKSLFNRQLEITAAHAILDRISHEQWAFLLEANKLLVSSLDFEEAFSKAVSLALPNFADYCKIEIIDGPVCRRQERYWMNGLVLVAPHNELDQELIFSKGTKVSRIIKRDDNPDDFNSLNINHEVIKQLSLVSAIVVPLLRQNEEIGTITFAVGTSRSLYQEYDRDLAERIAQRVTLVLENSLAYKSVSETARTRQELLEIVAHDLKNPLTSVDLQAQLLLRKLAQDQTVGSDDIQGMRHSLMRLSAFVDNLLETCRVSSGHFSIKKQKDSLNRVILEAIDTLAPLAHSKRLRLSYELPENDLLCEFDYSRIFQVLLNTISNSIKFTAPNGFVNVKASGAENEITISVVDNGIGIKPEELANIFSRYWQSKENKAGGAGLGLAISKKIVDAHGGRISAESQVNIGTALHIVLVGS
jgi:signal transduction histidine kinase